MSPSSPAAAPVEDETLASPPPVVEDNEKPQEVEADPTSALPPDVDALIAELRASLTSAQTLLSTQATRLSTLTDLETEHAQLKDQYAFLAAAKDAVEKQLQEEVKRREVAEENVELLRGQVEQARRGVGILQKQEQERKRLSLLPSSSGPGLGLLNTAVESEEVLVDQAGKDNSGTTSRASKRASMLVGRTHRRQSSQSEPGGNVYDTLSASGPSMPSAHSPNPNAPRAGGLRELRLGSANSPITSTGPNALASPSAITTGFFEDTTPLPVPPVLPNRPSSNSVTSPPLELGPSEEETKLRAEVTALKGKLLAAEESREASESCLKALREFMAGGGTEGGAAEEDLLKNIRLPPLPTDRDPDEDANQAEQAEQPKKGWGFKLWKQQGPASPSLSTNVEPPATPLERFSSASSVGEARTPKVGSPLPSHGELPTEGIVNAVPPSSTPLTSFVSGWTKSVVPGTPGNEAKPAPSRSISSFFSRKKEENAPMKEKNLPPQPEEDVQAEETQALSPSPQIADKRLEEAEAPQAIEKDEQPGEAAQENQSTLQEVSLNDSVDEHKK